MQPCLLAPAHEAAAGLRELGVRFTEVLKEGNLSEVDQICAKIGQAASSGLLARNAALLGIVVASIDLLERSDRDKTTMRNRQGNSTELELIRQATSLLVANGCAPSLLKSFGLSRPRASDDLGATDAGECGRGVVWACVG